MNIEQVAHGLGWFSIGLGTTQLLAPRKLGRAIGVGEHPGAMRGMGLREIASGIGILAPQWPKVGLWSRVIGDMLDFSILAGVANKRERKRSRLLAAAGAVLAVGVLDYVCARAFS